MFEGTATLNGLMLVVMLYLIGVITIGIQSWFMHLFF